MHCLAQSRLQLTAQDAVVVLLETNRYALYPVYEVLQEE